MWICFAYLFLFISIVKCGEMQLKYMNGTEIKDLSYCDKITCIIKCCPEGYFIKNNNESKPECLAIVKKKEITIEHILKEIKNQRKHSEIILVQNNEVLKKAFYYGPMELIENGSVIMPGVIVSRFEYCVDFEVVEDNGNSSIELRYRLIPAPDQERLIKDFYTGIVMLISCFFLLLMILVYLLLPDVLEGFVGLLLVSNVTAIFIAFLLRASMYLTIVYEVLDDVGCTYLTPVTYYFILTIFFWSNILSYDLWRYTGNLKPRCDLSSKTKLTYEEKKKYLQYWLYACGYPAQITLFVVVVKIQGWYFPNWDPPIFECFRMNNAYPLLITLPIGLTLIVNCIFFFKTAYYIWIVKVNVINSANSRNKKSGRNRFFLYLKMLVIMGLYWVLEFIPEMPLIAFLIINLYFMFIGPVIFFTLTWNKKIYSKFYNKFIIRKKVNQQTFATSSILKTNTNNKYQSNEQQTEEVLLP